MRFLFASILLFFFISCSESIKKEDLKMLYPDKEKPIKFQQDWQFEFYYNRIEEFKINPIGFNKIVFLGNSITEAGADWNKRFNVQNIGILKFFEKEKRSIFLICGHYSSWEWMMSLGYHIKHKGYGIYRPIRNPYFDRLINKINPAP